jgi:hypothetical protein
MINLIIKRSEWARTSYSERTVLGNGLYNSETGKRCCMGFDCHFVHGISDYILSRNWMPHQIPLRHLQVQWLGRNRLNSWPLETILATVNDRNSYKTELEWVNDVSDEEQEKIIARLYTIVDYKVEFVD